MRRRRYVGAVAAACVTAVSGCLAAGGDRGTTARTLDPAQVTTTGGAAVEILVAQVVIQEDDDGPRIYYQLRNDGSEDATVAVRTVYRIDGAGTYEATAYTDVGAGQEIFLEYRIVRYEALTADERARVRRGEADFDTYVNGEPRTDV